MKKWEMHGRMARKVLRGYAKRFRWGGYGLSLIEDAVSYALCECWHVDDLGLNYEQTSKMITRYAARFINREVRTALRMAPTSFGETAYSAFDYFVAVPATQENDCDAAKVRAVIGSDEMAEMIAYGDKAEGGLHRIKMERLTREHFKTYRPLDERGKS